MKIDADIDSKKKADLQEILKQAKKNGHSVTTTGNVGQLKDKVQKLRNDAKNASTLAAGSAAQEEEQEQEEEPKVVKKTRAAYAAGDGMLKDIISDHANLAGRTIVCLHTLGVKASFEEMEDRDKFERIDEGLSPVQDLVEKVMEVLQNFPLYDQPGVKCTALAKKLRADFGTVTAAAQTRDMFATFGIAPSTISKNDLAVEATSDVLEAEVDSRIELDSDPVVPDENPNEPPKQQDDSADKNLLSQLNGIRLLHR